MSGGVKLKKKSAMMHNEPGRLTDDAIDEVFKWCFEINASDITFQTGQPVWADVYGRIQHVTKRYLSPAEVVDVLNRIYGPNGAAQIASGRDIDIAYEVKVSRNSRYRFRINATGVLVDGTDGIQVTARTLPEDPPKLSSMNVEQEIVENYAPRQGMVLVTGPTGSGKSTLLASIIKELSEDPESNRKVLTYESPIEFVYDSLETPTSVISQSEIPKHLPSFAAGGRPTVGQAAVIGEKGPELFVPSVAGTIIPNNMLGGGQPVNVNFNINTVDARGFNELLVNSRGVIVNMINSAVNEKGRQAII